MSGVVFYIWAFSVPAKKIFEIDKSLIILGAAANPAGTRIALVYTEKFWGGYKRSPDSTLAVYDTATGKNIWSAHLGNIDESDLRVSWDESGKFLTPGLVSLSRPFSPLVFNAETGGAEFNPQCWGAVGIFSPSGKYLLLNKRARFYSIVDTVNWGEVKMARKFMSHEQCSWLKGDKIITNYDDQGRFMYNRFPVVDPVVGTTVRYVEFVQKFNVFKPSGFTLPRVDCQVGGQGFLNYSNGGFYEFNSVFGSKGVDKMLRPTARRIVPFFAASSDNEIMISFSGSGVPFFHRYYLVFFNIGCPEEYRIIDSSWGFIFPFFSDRDAFYANKNIIFKLNKNDH